MIARTNVKSFYNGLIVTCYEYNGIKYVANQHGNWDVYEGEYVRGAKSRTVEKEAEEIKKIISEHRKQENGAK